MMVPLTRPLAYMVADDLRPWDRREVSASVGHGDMRRWVDELFAMPERMDCQAESYACLSAPGTPIAMGGVVLSLGRAFPWFVATPRLKQRASEIHLWALRVHRSLRGRADRCTVASLDGHDEGRRWLERLGYTPCGAMTRSGAPFTMLTYEVPHV